MLKRLTEIWNSLRRQGWRSPEALLLLFSAASSLSFATWMALLNNFAVERAAFTGAEMGVLQSLREVPGFLAFTAVFVLLILREQGLQHPHLDPHQTGQGIEQLGMAMLVGRHDMAVGIGPRITDNRMAGAGQRAALGIEAHLAVSRHYLALCR